MPTKSILRILLIAGILFGLASHAFADDKIFNGMPTCTDGRMLIYKGGNPICGPVCEDGQSLVYSSGEPVCTPACEDGQTLVYYNGAPVCSPVCADGQTLVYSGGVPTCGPACPGYVFTSFGTLGGVAYNVPASEVGEVHPPANSAGLASGGSRNATICTFHLQCTANGWIAMTTGADACQSITQGVQ